MNYYKITNWYTASVPSVSYVVAKSKKEAEEKSSTSYYEYDFDNTVFAEIENTIIKEES